MSDLIRTFVAVDFPAEPLQTVLSDLTDLGRPIRVAAVPLHLTLNFLGDVERTAVDHIARAVAEVAQQHVPFEVALTGVDAFPRKQRPSVVWVGVSPAEPLSDLADELASRFEPLGFPRESRPFQPHVTIARVKGRPPRELADLFELYGTEEFGTATVRQMHLYKSTLRPQGPQYTIIRSAALKAS